MIGVYSLSTKSTVGVGGKADWTRLVYGDQGGTAKAAACALPLLVAPNRLR